MAEAVTELGHSAQWMFLLIISMSWVTGGTGGGPEHYPSFP
jgi:hypothetical protein